MTPAEKRLRKVAAVIQASIDQQPINRVRWCHRDELHANRYNPNHVAPPEMRLLKISILEDGWTQPIVCLPDGEIVDGFHRWMIAADPEVSARTGGMVPTVELAETDRAHQKMSTIRHNRARGAHSVLRMADIVADLAADGVSAEEIGRRLQMDKEEVSRLLDRGDMLKRGAAPAGFNKGWKPTKRSQKANG